jgi:hypothetical protein
VEFFTAQALRDWHWKNGGLGVQADFPIIGTAMRCIL